MALSLRASRYTQQVWFTEEQAFVAGAPWTLVHGGRAIVHPELPEVWDASFVSHLRPPFDVRRFLDESSEVLRRAGCGHLKILVDQPAVNHEVGAELLRRGLSLRSYVTMSTRRLPPLRSPRPPVMVRAVRTAEDRRAMALLRDEVRKEAPWYAREVSDALDTWEDLQASTLDLTWLLAWYEGEPAGAVGLLFTPGGASLQSLATAPRLRDRGVGSTLVREVVSRALARGARWVSLLTDRDDRPRQMYRRLGFSEVGEVSEYLRSLE